MKLIIRADDVGYTNVHNLGTFKAIEEGVITAADVMLDCEGTEEALSFLKQRPYISIGWHTHLWGKPVAGAEKVPSMVNDSGKFKWRKNRKLLEEAVYEEVFLELSAELELCIKIIGKVPDVSFEPEDYGDYAKAMRDVLDTYGIKTGYMNVIRNEKLIEKASEVYEKLNIYRVDAFKQYKNAYKNHDNSNEYNPLYFYKNYFTKEMLESDRIYVTPWHPGYLDELVVKESSMTEARIKDVDFLCSQEFKNWLIDNRVELINFRDALYHTNEYQNYLKHINSPLYIPK